jgi:predicted PurR-regulated permease PerM
VHAFGACRTGAEAEILVSPLLILVAILIGSSIGDWLGGSFGAFVAALLSIPCAAALQVITRELWQATVPGGTLGSGPGLGRRPPARHSTPRAKGN